MALGTGVDVISEAVALRSALARGVRALSGHAERGGVWGEHSYARRVAARAHWRLLAPAPPAPTPATLDVEACEPAPPPLPRDEPVDSGSESDGTAEEARAHTAPAALQPLLRAARAVLADLRLQRRAARAGPVTRRRQIAAAARRLRARWAGASADRAAAAAAALGAGRLWAELRAELRARSPALAAALPPAPPLPPHPYSVLLEQEGLGASAGVWVAWVGGAGGADAERAERSWRRALAQHAHVRSLPRAAPGPPGPPAPGPAAAAPAAAAANAARAALDDLLRDATVSEKPLFLAGLASGAALALALASGASGVRGVVALGAAPLCAEGAVPAARAPLLAVCGERGAGGGGGAGAGSLRGAKVLRVAGADDLLRTRRAPAVALASAVAEEAARWMTTTLAGSADGADGAAGDAGAADAGADPRDDGWLSVEEDVDVDEYAHLAPCAPPEPPAAAPAAPQLATPPHKAARRLADYTNNRSIEIIEGGVVSRVSGGTPLQLGGAGAGGAALPGALAAADIMRMPVVLAPAPPAAAADDPALTVTSGATRVVSATSASSGSVASVAGGGATSAGAGGGATAVGGAGGGALKYTRVVVGRGAGARPLLLRRTVRLLPRARVASPRAARAAAARPSP